MLCWSKCIDLGAGLPRSGKNIWKMKFFPGQGKVREFYGWLGKFRKDLRKSWKSQGIELCILLKRGKDVLANEIV